MKLYFLTIKALITQAHQAPGTHFLDRSRQEIMCPITYLIFFFARKSHSQSLEQDFTHLCIVLATKLARVIDAYFLTILTLSNAVGSMETNILIVI